MTPITSRDDIFKVACALAADLAEDELAENIGQLMIERGREKAQAIRAKVDANQDGAGPEFTACQEYRTIRWSVYGACYSLLEGYKGYRLVKIDD